MTEEQAEAFDLIHFVAEKHGLAMSLGPGDILLFNDLGVLHGRNNLRDAHTVYKRRHILRLWVRNEEKAWKTLPQLELDWHSVYGDSERPSHSFWRINPEDVEKRK
ncbi:hypothetical protein MGN70_006568 [Eutypa lata]|nr:hypothetical protein MGN70_006568 [Eutypa lata]